jgi:hypothetical protein
VLRLVWEKNSRTPILDNMCEASHIAFCFKGRSRTDVKFVGKSTFLVEQHVFPDAPGVNVRATTDVVAGDLVRL